MSQYAKPIEMMIPSKEVNLQQWAVVACDQYTSQPEYWQQVEEQVGQAPSTLRLILPEYQLEQPGIEEKIQTIHSRMEAYQKEGVLAQFGAGIMVVERQLDGTNQRRYGLVMGFDLEAYDYQEGSISAIRPTERTVQERIPSRMAVRKGASLELPHILLLMDDPEDKILGLARKQVEGQPACYSTSLMQKGGAVTGWWIPAGEKTQPIEDALQELADRKRFEERYGVDASCPMVVFATGDGNHSMAAAKANWEQIRATLSEEERQIHPARWVLAELVNLNEESLEMEPIHRLACGVSLEVFQQKAQEFFASNQMKVSFTDAPVQPEQGWEMELFYEKEQLWMQLEGETWALPVAAIQAFLDDLSGQLDYKLDYIHGRDTLCQLSEKSEHLGILLPDFEKKQLFAGVVKDGVLPRKTFSMGRANDKRFYLECRRILP